MRELAGGPLRGVRPRVDRRGERCARASPLRPAPVGCPRQILWNDQCAERARMRHPLMNVLAGLRTRRTTGGRSRRMASASPFSVSGRAASATPAARRAASWPRGPAARTAHGRARVVTAPRLRIARPDVRFPSGPGAWAHPAAAGHSREPEGSARGAGPGRDHGHRDCRRTRFRAAHGAPARGADGAAGGVRPGRERGARPPAVAARTARGAAPVRAARRSLARESGSSLAMFWRNWARERAAPRAAPIHANGGAASGRAIESIRWGLRP